MSFSFDACKNKCKTEIEKSPKILYCNFTVGLYLSCSKKEWNDIAKYYMDEKDCMKTVMHKELCENNTDQHKYVIF